MSIKYYKCRIFRVYCSYKIHLSYKKNWSVSKYLFEQERRPKSNWLVQNDRVYELRQ